MDFDLTYLSFGAGRQSTALAICSALGLHGVPKADVAIFSDTQGEIAPTYAHIEVMRAWLAARGIPLDVVTAGNLEESVLHGRGPGTSHASIPAFIRNADGSLSLQRRFCTRDYKLFPIIKAARARVGLAPGQRAKDRVRVRAMLGISWDEAMRMKDSPEPWITNTYPLVDARLTVHDCQRIIAEAGIPQPPRSSCYFCPYHSRKYWTWLKTEQPTEFAKAVAFDAKLRHSQPGLEGEAFLHRDLKPLDQVDFSPPESVQRELFGEECEGVCGV